MRNRKIRALCGALATGVLLAPLTGLAQHTLTGELPKPGAAGPAVVLVAGATGRTGRQLLGGPGKGGPLPSDSLPLSARPPPHGPRRPSPRVGDAS
jgi:hypothetical protein